MLEAVQIDSYGATDIGKQRRANEDQFLVAGLRKEMLVQQTSVSVDDQTRLTGGMQGKLLAVADGMGGQAGGERASEVAVRTITEYVVNTMPWFFGLDRRHEDDLVEKLAAALETCRARLRAVSQAEPSLASMGTTLTMAYVLWPRAYIVHAGDSRCYRLRDGKLRQLTKDHSLAQQLVDQGTLSPEEVEDSRYEHILHNAIVADDSTELAPVVYKTALANDDTLLLCTDGLTKHLSDADIHAAVTAATSAEEASTELVRRANEAGGSDNVTVVVARFRKPEDQSGH